VQSSGERDPLTPHPEAKGKGAVLITGICGRLGRQLARRLHRERRVIGVDRRAFPGCPKDIEHHAIDLRRKRTKDLFRHGEIEAVVHLGIMHDPRVSQAEHHTWNVAGFQRLIDNAQFLVEEAPLLGGAEFSGIRDLIEVDMQAQSFFWKRPQTETVVLRPVHILGSVRNAPSNYLRLSVIPTLLGFDPMIQVVHQDDVVSAIIAALRPGVRGIFNLAGPPPLPLSHLVRKTGRPHVPIPHTVAKGALGRLFRYHASSFPAPELQHIRYVCMVDDSRARKALDYQPQRNADETVRAVDGLL